MPRQVTLDDLFTELIDACGRDAGMQAFKIISQHLENGDRIKIDPRPVAQATEVPPLPIGVTPDYGYEVGDTDPTPSQPPWCMARVRHPEGGDYCTWPPDHGGVHVSGDDMKINAVFTDAEIVGWHEHAGKTAAEIKASALAEIGDERDVDPPPSEGRVRVESALPEGDTTLWRMTAALRDRVEQTVASEKISKRDLVRTIVLITDLLTAVTERMDK